MLILSCAGLILGVAGCRGGGGGGADKPKVVPVSGTVKLDGQPAAGIGVMFFPAGATRGTTYYASTDQSGKYVLAGGDGQKGAPVGEFNVTCSKYVMPNGSPFTSDGSQSPEMAGAKELLPPRYSDQSKTQLKATVQDSGSTVDFEVTSK